MSQAIVDPIELRRFAQNLKKFNTELEERLTSLRAQLHSLGATWRDQEHKKFVEDFKKKYNRSPSLYAAQSYDAAMLINAALVKTGGKADNKDALRAALKSAEFKSVAGPFKFNTNQFPIRNFYRVDVAKDASGQAAFVNKGVVLKDHADAYYKECAMK
jgi:branched-chain amino acid transport system substrate-binding protein